jgi:hypothetical protein
MESQFLIVDLGWFFLAAWTTILLALGAIAFGKDLLAFHRSAKTGIR